MKQRLRITTQLLLITLIVLSTSACVVQSLHRYYTLDKEIATPAEIMGKWNLVTKKKSNIAVSDTNAPAKSNKPKTIDPWVFSNRMLTTYDEHNVKSMLKYKFFKVGDQLYCNLTAKAADKSMRKSVNFYWILNVAPVHTLTKVVLKDDKLSFYAIDESWLKKQVDSKAIDLAYIKTDGNVVLYTSPPEKWVAFLAQHGKTTEAFYKSPFVVLSRHKAGTTEAKPADTPGPDKPAAGK